MGLSQATMNAIARAQKATSVSTASIGSKAFAESFEKGYEKQVEKLKKEEEKMEKAKINSLNTLEELTSLGTKLGKFGPEGEKILKAAKDRIYETYNLDSQFDQTVKQREIMAEVRKELEPFAETNLYLASVIESNTTKTLDKSMTEVKNFAGTEFNKYEVLQALGENHEVVDRENIRTFIGEGDDRKEIILKISDLKTQDFAISNKDLNLQKQYLDDENQFVRDARQSNMTNAQVENMVDEYMMNIDQQGKKDLLYNFFNVDLSEQAANIEEGQEIYKDALKARMLERITGRYNYDFEKPDSNQNKINQYKQLFRDIDKITFSTGAGQQALGLEGNITTLSNLPSNYSVFQETSTDRDTGVTTPTGRFTIRNNSGGADIVVTKDIKLQDLKNKLKGAYRQESINLGDDFGFFGLPIIN
tara:strand:- start:476 stop:1732 length:1257 start_codon:yes stop_codon:yes gene_type:complete